MRLPSLAVLLLALLFGFGIATATPTLSVMFSSDILLPTDWSHNLLLSPGTIGSFELPRVPSLVPDLLAVLLLTLALPWRLALVVYAALSFTALVAAGGAVAARMSGRPFAAAAAAFGSLAALALLADMQWNEGLGGWYLILYPAIHSGTVLMTFAALLLLARFLRAPGRTGGVLLAATIALAQLSDGLFLPCFIPAAVAGVLAAGWSRIGLPAALRPRWWGRPAVAVAAGFAAGLVLEHLLFHSLLFRQPGLGVNLRLQWSRFPALLHDRTTWVGAACALAAALLPSAATRRNPEAAFWWAACATGALAMAAALFLVFIDWTSYRYIQIAWWWAVVALAALLLRPAPRLAPVVLLLVATAATGLATLHRGDLFAARAASTWHHPAQLCLSDLQRQDRVHAVLADFWLARPIAASGDWTLPVAQIHPDGKPQFWGNNRLDYDRYPFDAVVANRLAPAAAARFGPPDATVDCAGFTFWLYDRFPGHLRNRIAGTDTRLGPATVPVRFGPADLATRDGPLPATGLVPPTPPGPRPGTFGPFASIAPGPWRMLLRYSLAPGAPAPVQWEIGTGSGLPPFATGTLEPGEHRILAVPFTVPPATPKTPSPQPAATPRPAGTVNLHTNPAPGTQLTLSALGLCPATLDDAACRAATLPPD